MDDYNTLINSNDGSHCLIFLNQHGLEEKEIREIFSEFGYIHNLRYHKDKAGHWFVRYQSIDEAKYAVDNLKNHPKIKLSEHYKKKQTNRHVSDRSQNNDHGRQACDGKRFIQQFSKPSNNNINKSGHNRNGNYKENEYHGNFNTDLPWGPKSPNGNEKQNNLLRGSNSCQGNDEYNGNFNTDLPWGQKSPNGNKKQSNLLQGSNSCQGNYDGLPDLVDRNKKTMIEIENQEDEIPELVTSDGKTLKASNPMRKVLRAQEVIVANIHPKFGAPYILHLFDRFEPLAITNIMVEPKTTKRYCHVYFKSAEDSEQVETYFDKTVLLDQKLVVIRYSRLAESAK